MSIRQTFWPKLITTLDSFVETLSVILIQFLFLLSCKILKRFLKLRSKNLSSRAQEHLIYPQMILQCYRTRRKKSSNEDTFFIVQYTTFFLRFGPKITKFPLYFPFYSLLKNVQFQNLRDILIRSCVFVHVSVCSGTYVEIRKSDFDDFHLGLTVYK